MSIEDDPLDWSLDGKPPATTDAQLAGMTEESDFHWLMADPRGQRVMRRLLERTGVFRSTFTGDPLTSAFREGERNVGLGLVAQVGQHAPERLADVLTNKG